MPKPKSTTPPTNPPNRAAATQVTTEQWPIDRPKPYANNPRKITDEAVLKVAASIQRYGWRAPIVVDEQGTVLAGHTRLLAAKKLELKTVPVHVAKGLSPVEANAYRLADNRTGEETEWDAGKLSLELKDMPSDLPTGFDPDELDAMFADPLADAVLPMDTRAPPKMAWLLVGIPLVRYGEVAEFADKMAVLPDVIMKTSVTDYGAPDDA